jgi:uncharacterized protein YkwD
VLRAWLRNVGRGQRLCRRDQRFRRAHGLTAVKPDSKLSALALKQTQAMASGSISHSARNDDGG